MRAKGKAEWSTQSRGGRKGWGDLEHPGELGIVDFAPLDAAVVGISGQVVPLVHVNAVALVGNNVKQKLPPVEVAAPLFLLQRTGRVEMMMGWACWLTGGGIWEAHNRLRRACILWR